MLTLRCLFLLACVAAARALATRRALLGAAPAAVATVLANRARAAEPPVESDLQRSLREAAGTRGVDPRSHGAAAATLPAPSMPRPRAPGE
ncbi:hypothetical protein M885DRAFT_616795 [Pelagophyceae sp. CCMP2097]|nr:hypothetical protein M885DRAFT_616795 [Pelagophyceae sp. CCMP2097]